MTPERQRKIMLRAFSRAAREIDRGCRQAGATDAERTAVRTAFGRAGEAAIIAIQAGITSPEIFIGLPDNQARELTELLTETRGTA